jgi:hypothetical protein
MGQYLSTRLITSMKVFKSDVEKIGEEERTKVLEDLSLLVVGNPDSFELTEEDSFYLWKLKPDLVENCLNNFLEGYYEDFYEDEFLDIKNDQDSPYSLLISRSEDLSFQEFLEADNKPDYLNVGYSRWTLQHKDIQFCLIATEILLTMEGKISYESFFGHLNFFKESIRNRYSDTPFGGALTVDID